MTYTIYALFDEAEPDVIRYVGFSRNPETRHRQHLAEAINSPARSHRLSWIRKVLAGGRRVMWRALETADSADAAAKMEIDLIRQICEQPHRLVNGTEGGEGVQGFGGVLSEEALARRNATLNSPDYLQRRSALSAEYWSGEEARERQRKAMQDHWSSEDAAAHRARNSAVSKVLWEQPGHGDRVHSPVAREKMRAAKLGKPHAKERTAEWNAKIAESNKGKRHNMTPEGKARHAAAVREYWRRRREGKEPA